MCFNPDFDFNPKQTPDLVSIAIICYISEMLSLFERDSTYKDGFRGEALGFGKNNGQKMVGKGGQARIDKQYNIV